MDLAQHRIASTNRHAAHMAAKSPEEPPSHQRSMSCGVGGAHGTGPRTGQKFGGEMSKSSPSQECLLGGGVAAVGGPRAVPFAVEVLKRWIGHNIGLQAPNRHPISTVNT